MTTTRSENYFTEKYHLTAPHSEVVAALPQLPIGTALDIGCGNGRNALYLHQSGFDVTAWDKNPLSLTNLNQIITAESLSNIRTEHHDFNTLRFNGAYNFVFSTVVMMFLQPETVPQLIADMQASTVKNGFNLIVSAMDTRDFPCPVAFPFTFKSGELSNYYRQWQIIKYNENSGQLHKTDASGQRIKLRFATLLARKSPPED